MKKSNIEIPSKIEPSYPILGHQKNIYHNMVENPVVAPDFARTDVNKKLRVIAINFDGTWNDKDNVPANERQTLVASNHEDLKKIEESHSQIKSFYYKGVGTSSGGGMLERAIAATVNAYEGVRGYGCERNAELAHADVVKQISEWRREDPDIDVHIHVTGFSRGAATAIHFMNLVDKRGGISQYISPNNHPTIAPGKVKTSAVLLDPVSTGQSRTLDLSVPDSAISILTLIADGEERKTFKVRKVDDSPNEEISLATNVNLEGAKKLPNGTILYQRINELVFPAARHSDVGGSYSDGNIREVSEYMMKCYTRSLGIMVKPQKPTFEHIQNICFHDSRFGFQKKMDPKDEAELQSASNRPEEKAVTKDKLKELMIIDLHQSGLIDPKTGKNERNDFYSVSMSSKDFSNNPVSSYLGCKSSMEITLVGESLKIIKPINSPFHVVDDRLMFVDIKLPISSLSEIHQELKRQKLNGENVPAFSISIDLKRSGVVHVCKRDPNIQSMDKLEQPVDPWNSDIRRALIGLNQQAIPTAEIAAKIYNIVAKSSAKQIMECNAAKNLGINEVSVFQCINIEKTNDLNGSYKHDNKVGIMASLPGRNFSLSSPTTSSDENNMHTVMRHVSRGLESVSNELRKLGFKPNGSARQNFDENGLKPGCEAKSFVDKDSEISQHLTHTSVNLPLFFNAMVRGSLSERRQKLSIS